MSPSGLLVLPNELVLEVFANLTYWDLKLAVPLVCKRFKAIIESSSGNSGINRALFRGRPQPHPCVLTKTDMKPHPAFEKLEFPCIAEMDDVAFYTARNEEIKLTDTPVTDENAVSPPVDTLVMHLAYHPTSMETYVLKASGDGKGITVCNVMESLVMRLASSFRFSWGGIEALEVWKGHVHVFVMRGEKWRWTQDLIEKRAAMRIKALDENEEE